MPVSEWAVVAVFEFAEGPTDQAVLYQGEKRVCEAVAGKLERDFGAVPYRGVRVESVVGVALAVCRADALQA